MKPVTNMLHFSIIIFLLLVIPLVIHNVNATTQKITVGSLGAGSGQLNLPRGMAVDDSGNIYVADNRNHRVEEFDSSGKFVSEFDKGGIPEGIAIDRSGNINVVDRNNMTVEKFNPKGTLLSSFGSAGSDKGQLGNAERIALDSSGNIYVTDVNVIQKFNPNGKFISQFFANDTQNCCMNAMGIAIDGSDNVYVADMFYNRILKFNPAGSVLLSFNSSLSRQQAMSPQDVAVDSSGNIYVADTGNGRIVKFNSVGSQLSSISISGVPVGLAIDKSGKIYATDLANNRVDVFTTSQFTNSSVNSENITSPQSKVPLSQNSTALSAAIKLATSSPQFQSLVNGYNYTFSSNFEETGPLSTGGIGLTAHGFAFELYSGPVKPGTAVKEVEVLEDPTLTKILNVTSYQAAYAGGVIPTNSTIPKTTNSTILSPLEQFKSGIASNNVHCRQDLHLVIKTEDGSPACVKLDAAYVLIKRGWAASESAYPGGNAQFTLDTNSTIIPAHLPRSSGVRIPYYESSRIINYSGFDGIYNETFPYRGTQNDYVLKPGSTGIITFKIDAMASEQKDQDYSIPLPKSLNLTNYAVFYHEITNLKDLSKYPGVTFDDGNYGNFRACFTRPASEGTCIGGQFSGTNPIEAFVTDHQGVDVLFEPPLEVMPLGMNTTSQVVTMMITADSNAPRGTYLVQLSPIGLDSFLLTVGDQPYHE